MDGDTEYVVHCLAVDIHLCMDDWLQLYIQKHELEEHSFWNKLFYNLDRFGFVISFTEFRLRLKNKVSQVISLKNEFIVNNPLWSYELELQYKTPANLTPVRPAASHFRLFSTQSQPWPSFSNDTHNFFTLIPPFWHQRIHHLQHHSHENRWFDHK